MSAEQMIISSVVHWIAGALLAVTGWLAIRHPEQALGRSRFSRRLAQTMSVFGAVLFALELVDPALHHIEGGPPDPMRLYHLVIGALLTAGGLLEQLRLRSHPRSVGLGLVVPLAFVGVAAVFLVHEQSSRLALYRHWLFAITIAAAAGARLVAGLTRRDRWAQAWGGLMSAGGLQFILYWEG